MSSRSTRSRLRSELLFLAAVSSLYPGYGNTTQAVLAAACATAPVADAPAPGRPAPVHAAYTGTCAAGPLATLEIGAVEDLISAVPPFWGAKPNLRLVEGETFSFVLPHPEPDRTLTFERVPAGR